MLSVVVPILNEAHSLETLWNELSEVAAAEGYQLDVVFVDDGSSDGSWEVIRRLAAADGRLRGLRFRRNFGKAAALSAGFEAARGDLVMTLDADLQDDPHEIPRFLAEWGATSTWSAAGSRSGTIRCSKSSPRGYSTGWSAG